MTTDNKTISISAELYRQLEARVSSTSFSSVDEYATSLLVQVIKKEEEEEVKRRVRALGYME